MGGANDSTIIASPYHASVLSAGFSPRPWTMLPKQDTLKGFLSDPYDPAIWNISPSDIRFEANFLNTPSRTSALFALLTLPGHANWEILTVDNQEEVHLEAGLHPFYRDQILCIFFSPPLYSFKKQNFSNHLLLSNL